MNGDLQAAAPCTSACELPQAAAADTTGASPSNTAPANSIPRLANTLRIGVDSLYVSYRGRLNDTWAHRLPALKDLAQSTNLDERLQAQAKIGDHLFEVSDRGSGRFAYVLADAWYRIAIAAPTAKALPLAYVQIASEILTLEGIEHALRGLQFVINSVGIIESGPYVSRVDLCVDFASNCRMDAWGPAAWISRAPDRKSHTIGRNFSGWSIGQGGDIVARLYNKTLELERSRKFYLKPIWSAAGWNGSDPVWRLEFQLRREALVELGASLVADLQPRLGAIWRYCSENWLRLSVPNSADETPSRWPTHPLWLELAGAWSLHPAVGPGRQRARKDRPPTDEALFQNGLGGLTSFMASRGITNLAEGFGEFLAHAKAFHDTVGKDRSFGRYVNRRVSEKARRFNTLQTRRETLAEKAATHEVAERYRKAKDGE